MIIFFAVLIEILCILVLNLGFQIFEDPFALLLFKLLMELELSSLRLLILFQNLIFKLLNLMTELPEGLWLGVVFKLKQKFFAKSICICDELLGLTQYLCHFGGGVSI